MNTQLQKQRQYGVTLIEIMVAVAIGMLAMYAVYTVYGGSERTKRNVSSVGDAQIAGLYSMSLLEHKISNTGSGLMANQTVGATPTGSAANLMGCPAAPVQPTGAGPSVLSLRPIPVIIDNPAGNTADPFSPDQLFLFAGSSSVSLFPLTNRATITTGANPTLTVQAPLGFRNGGALIVQSGAICQAYNITNTVLNPADGMATVTLQGAAFPAGAANVQVVDLGTVSRNRIFLNANGVLSMEEWVLNNNSRWRLNRTDPIISNVVLFRAQYGIDTNGNGAVDQWVWPNAPQDMATLQGAAATLAQITSIRAIRIAVVIRVDELDRNFNDAFTQILFSDCGLLNAANCSPMDVDIAKGTDPGGIPPPAGSSWRYRAYETIIPLKNTITNFP